MSPEIRASISDSYPGVAFIDRDREPGLLGGDGSPPSGATIVYVGLLRWLAPDVLEVEVGTVAASNGYKSAWFQYEKVNGIRIPAIGDDTGTPLTTAVS